MSRLPEYDPAARDFILRTIITNYNENATILLSTHLITDIENILDEVIFQKNGPASPTSQSPREKQGKSMILISGRYTHVREINKI